MPVQIDLGSTPDWIMAISAIVSTGVAVVIWRLTNRTTVANEKLVEMNARSIDLVLAERAEEKEKTRLPWRNLLAAIQARSRQYRAYGTLGFRRKATDYMGHDPFVGLTEDERQMIENSKYVSFDLYQSLNRMAMSTVTADMWIIQCFSHRPGDEVPALDVAYENAFDLLDADLAAAGVQIEHL